MAQEQEFLGEDNACGQTLLKLVSRGSSIIAELLRLSDYVPSAFWNNPPAESKIYSAIIQDFTYLKNVDEYEEKIYEDPDLLELDENFREAQIGMLERFYILFQAIFRYYKDYMYFIQELQDGAFIQHTPESVLLNVDGKRLMCEAVYYFGVMLLLLDRKIEGVVRERLLVSYYRYKGHSTIPNIDDVCNLCRTTGYVYNKTRPDNYPEEYFARFQIPLDIVMMIIGHLKDDDIYQQIAAYPTPEHRTTALANQASVLFVTLFFVPSILQNETNQMRELVDKFFPDNWVIPYYLGYLVDLSWQWAPYRAAKEAITKYSMSQENITQRVQFHSDKLLSNINHLNELLSEGKLVPDYIIENVSRLLHYMRNCNVTLRWLLVHRHSTNKKITDYLNASFEKEDLLQLLMWTAQYESKLRAQLEAMLENKEKSWDDDKFQAAIRMKEISEYFSGNRPLTRGVEKNEQYEAWFSNMEKHINELTYAEATSASRKIQQLIQALDDVEQYHQIEDNLQIKQFIDETRNYLKHMVSTVNLNMDVLIHISRISDFSYAWLCMDDFLGLIQQKIKRSPRSALLLKSTILKLRSIMDVPLVHIIESNSGDMESVSDYYSNKLVDYVRKVLQIIPQAVFEILDEVTELQARSIKEMPSRVTRDELKELAALDDRHHCAMLTHQISVFTQGIMVMDTTLIGTVEVDPKQLLEVGIRRELVIKITSLIDSILVFKKGSLEDFLERLDQLQYKIVGFRKAFEHIQDFIGTYGLKLWQEEMNRIITFYVEHEASSFMPIKPSTDDNSTIPIPKLPPQDDKSVGFMGRLAREILNMTSPSRTIYMEWMHGWYDFNGKEIVGLQLLNKIHASLGITGLVELDRLMSCMIVNNVKQFIRRYKTEIKSVNFDSLWQELQPLSRIPERGRTLYVNIIQQLKTLPANFAPMIMRIGQLQLLRRLIAYELNFTGRIQATYLWTALKNMNTSIINDINNLSELGEDMVIEVEKFLVQMGFSQAFEKVYIKPGDALDKFPLVMAMFVITQISTTLTYDKRFGGLVKKTQKDVIDGQSYTAGLLTIFRQFNSEHTISFLGYLGQYIKASVNVRESNKQKNQINELSSDLLNCLVFVEEFRKFAGMSKSQMEQFIPVYILEKFPN